MKARSVVRWTLLATLVFLLLAAACAPAAPPAATEPSAATEAATEATEQPAMPEATEPVSGVVTFITHADYPFEVTALLQAVDEFVTQYPGITVNCTIVIPVENWANRQSKSCAFVVAQ